MEYTFEQMCLKLIIQDIEQENLKSLLMYLVYAVKKSNLYMFCLTGRVQRIMIEFLGMLLQNPMV